MRSEVYKVVLVFLIVGWYFQSYSATKGYKPARDPVIEESDSGRSIGFGNALRLKYDPDERLYYVGDPLSSESNAHAQNSRLRVETAGSIRYTLDSSEEFPMFSYGPGEGILSRRSWFTGLFFDSFMPGAAGALAGLASHSYFHNHFSLSFLIAAAGAATIYSGQYYIGDRGNYAESVLEEGNDRRVFLGREDCTSWPYRVHGHVFMKYPSAGYIGSGTLIGERYVLTAAHNLYSRNTGRTPEVVMFYPGRYGAHAPMRSLVTNLYIHPEYATASDRRAKQVDIGLMELQKPLGRDVGFFGINDFSEGVEGVTVSVTGYPGGQNNGRFMYTMKGLTARH